MPKIPLDRFNRPDSASTLGSGAGLPPEAAERLQGLERVNRRIEREISAASYLLDSTRDLREGARDPGAVDLQFFGNFRQSTERRMFQTLTAAPESVRSGLRKDLSALGAALKDKSMTMEGEARAVQRRVRLGALFETFAEIVRNDPTQVEAILSRATAVFDDMALPEDRRAEIRRHVRDQIGNAALDGLLEDPADAQGLLNAGDFDALLTPESLAARRAQVNGEVQRAQILAKERTMIDLSEAADTGGLTGKGIDDALRAGTLTKLEADFLRAKNDDALASAAREQALLDRIPAKNGRFNPTSPEDQETIDALWKVAGEQISAGKPGEQASRELRFVRNRGVLPTALRNKYSGLLYSADPALQVAGARAFAALEKIDPRLIERFPPEVQDRARAIGEFADIPLASDLVVSLAEDELAKSNQAEGAEEFPEEAKATASPTNTPENIQELASAEEADPEENVLADTQGVTRPVRTSKQFVGLLEDTFGRPETVIDQRAREAGVAPDLLRIGLSLLSANDASAAGRAEILERARRDIKALPDSRGIPKEQLRKLVDGLGPVLGDRDKTLQAIAANREAFRDRFSQNRDPAKQVRDLSIRLAETTGFEARFETGLTRAEGGLDPTDPRADVAEELPIESGADQSIRLPRVAFFRKGSDTPFMTLPHSVATAVMSDAKENEEKLDFLERWFAGALLTQALDERAKALFGEGDDFNTFVTADLALRDGENPQIVLASVIQTFFPKLSNDSNIVLDILFEMVPGIGQIVAVKEGVKDFDALSAAIKERNFEAAAVAGLGTALQIAAFAPGIGPLVKNLGNASRNPRIARWLRDTKGVKKFHSRSVLAKAQELGPKTDIRELIKLTRSARAKEMFADVWPSLNDSQRRTMESLLSHIKGQSGDEEIRQLLRNAGFTTAVNQAARTVKVGEKGRIFDIVTSVGFRRLFNTFILPRHGGRGSLIEIKADAAVRPERELKKEIQIKKQISEEGKTTTKKSNASKKDTDENPLEAGEIEADTIEILRIPIFQVPEDQFVATVKRLLDGNVKRGKSQLKKLDDNQINSLVESARNWHQRARIEKNNGVDIAKFLVSFGLLAAATETKHRLIERKREFDRRTGVGVEESLNQPFGS